MRKISKIVLIGLVVLFAVAQFLRPDLSNPPTNAEQRLDGVSAVPEAVAAILRRSCNDCHTNETHHPWYAQVSPISWWLKGHIDGARAELNFSEWGTYSERKRSRKLEEICDQVRGGQMPLPSYTWMHSDAVLTETDINVVCEWTSAEVMRLQPAK